MLISIKSIFCSYGIPKNAPSVPNVLFISIKFNMKVYWVVHESSSFTTHYKTSKIRWKYPSMYRINYQYNTYLGFGMDRRRQVVTNSYSRSLFSMRFAFGPSLPFHQLELSWEESDFALENRKSSMKSIQIPESRVYMVWGNPAQLSLETCWWMSMANVDELDWD